MSKVPYNSSLVHNAILGLLNREPNLFYPHPTTGSYFYVYIPIDEAEGDKLKKDVFTIKKWLDMFETTFSETRVDYGLEVDTKKFEKEVLVIAIKHPVAENVA